LFKFGKLKNK